MLGGVGTNPAPSARLGRTSSAHSALSMHPRREAGAREERGSGRAPAPETTSRRGRATGTNRAPNGSSGRDQQRAQRAAGPPETRGRGVVGERRRAPTSGGDDKPAEGKLLRRTPRPAACLGGISSTPSARLVRPRRDTKGSEDSRAGRAARAGMTRPPRPPSATPGQFGATRGLSGTSQRRAECAVETSGARARGEEGARAEGGHWRRR